MGNRRMRGKTGPYLRLIEDQILPHFSSSNAAFPTGCTLYPAAQGIHVAIFKVRAHLLPYVRIAQQLHQWSDRIGPWGQSSSSRTPTSIHSWFFSLLQLSGLEREVGDDTEEEMQSGGLVFLPILVFLFVSGKWKNRWLVSAPSPSPRGSVFGMLPYAFGGLGWAQVEGIGATKKF